MDGPRNVRKRGKRHLRTRSSSGSSPTEENIWAGGRDDFFSLFHCCPSRLKPTLESSGRMDLQLGIPAAEKLTLLQPPPPTRLSRGIHASITSAVKAPSLPVMNGRLGQLSVVPSEAGRFLNSSLILQVPRDSSKTLISSRFVHQLMKAHIFLRLHLNRVRSDLSIICGIHLDWLTGSRLPHQIRFHLAQTEISVPFQLDGLEKHLRTYSHILPPRAKLS